MDTGWLDAVVEEYRWELHRLLERHPALRADKGDLAGLARRGAQATAAPMLWAEAVGEKLDTRAVTFLLGVSRQALAQRVAAGTLLGIPGQGTTWFPTWQLDTSRQPARVRPVVAGVLGVWRDVLGSRYDPLLVAGWANASQFGELRDGELTDLTPAEWISREGDDKPLLLAAKRAAQGLAQ